MTRRKPLPLIRASLPEPAVALSGKRSAKHAALVATSAALRGWASGPWQSVRGAERGVASEAQAHRAAVNVWEDEGGATLVPIVTKFGARLVATHRRAARS